MRFSILLPLVLATGALATPVLQRDTWSAPTDEVRNLLARDRHHGGDDSDSNSTIGSAFTPTPIHDCMTEGQATKIVNAFLYLLENPKAANFNATATALLTKHYTDTSDSINQLAGLPVGSCPFIHYSLFSVLDVPRPFHQLTRVAITGRISYLLKQGSFHCWIRGTAPTLPPDPRYLQRLQQDRLALDLYQRYWRRRREG